MYVLPYERNQLLTFPLPDGLPSAPCDMMGTGHVGGNSVDKQGKMVAIFSLGECRNLTTVNARHEAKSHLHNSHDV